MGWSGTKGHGWRWEGCSAKGGKTGSRARKSLVAVVWRAGNRPTLKLPVAYVTVTVKSTVQEPVIACVGI